MRPQRNAKTGTNARFPAGFSDERERERETERDRERQRHRQRERERVDG